MCYRSLPVKDRTTSVVRYKVYNLAVNQMSSDVGSSILSRRTKQSNSTQKGSTMNTQYAPDYPTPTTTVVTVPTTGYNELPATGGDSIVYTVAGLIIVVAGLAAMVAGFFANRNPRR